MGQEATRQYAGDQVSLTARAAATAYEVWQAPDGRAGHNTSASGVAADAPASLSASGTVIVPKATGFVGLAGLEAWWDFSANAVSYRRVGDRDFYLGVFVDDADLNDDTALVSFNVPCLPTLDLLRDPGFLSVLAGTPAAGGFGYPAYLGGAHVFELSVTNEAQKVDALSLDTFAALGSRAIVEFEFEVLSAGAAGAQDFTLGVTNGTHASDADGITQAFLMHIDGGATAINFESRDGTTTVARIASGSTYAAGSALANRVRVWLDLRDQTDAQVYVNGVNVLPASVFNVNAAAAEWQILAHLEKTVSADVFKARLHKARAFLAQQRDAAL